MKYIALLLLGVVSATQHQSNSIAHLGSRHQAQAMNAESDSSDDENEMVQIEGDDGIIDALTPGKGSCQERLWINEDELNW